MIPAPVSKPGRRSKSNAITILPTSLLVNWRSATSQSDRAPSI